MKEIVKQRIEEYYKDYLKQMNGKNRMKYKYENKYSESDLDEYILKVLADIYSMPKSDENSLIYHGWDIIEPTIELILEEK